MSHTAQSADTSRTPNSQRPRGKQSKLTAGQMPSWTWAVVLAGALVVGAGIAALMGGGNFSVVGWLIVSAILYVAGMYVTTRVLENGRKATDGLWRNLVWAAFFVALIPLVAVIWSVLANGLTTLIANPHLMWNDMSGAARGDVQYMADGEQGPMPGGFGHALVGTLMITLFAALISVPIGLLTSIYLVEYSRGGWFARSITFFVDVMTGIPSIVAGLFAFALMELIITTFIGDTPRYLQMVKMGLTASIALSVLMIPVVVRSTEEMLRVVPNELREASYALGVRKWRTITKVVIPTAISGIASGITLAIARVAGETAPILVTAGFVANYNWNVFNDMMTALPVYIYNLMMRPTAAQAPDPSIDRAWAAALLLIVIVMLLNLIARIIAKAFAPKKTGR